MILWAILTLMCCAASLAVAVPLIRRYDESRDSATSMAIYQAQLTEIEREEKSGQIAEKEAHIARTEVQRRMLAAAKSAEGPARKLPPLVQTALVFGSGLFVALGGVALYANLGQPHLTPAITGQTAPATQTETVDSKITALEERLKSNPADAKGWRMLGWAYFNTENYAKSVTAYGKALELAPDELEVKSAYAEAQVMAAGNVVTPAARHIFEDVLTKDPKEPRARFYKSLALEQAGESQAALDSWLALYADAPADAGWLTDVRSHASDIAKKLNKDIASQLAAKPAPAPGPETNPEMAAQIKEMAPQDQQAMIASMVQRLADRLKENPKDAQGWQRLIQARMILKDEPAAQQALADGLKAFEGDAAAQEALKSAAAESGLAAQ